MVTKDEARKAIKALSESHAAYFKQAGVDDGDVIALGRLERDMNAVCSLLAMALLFSNANDQ